MSTKKGFTLAEVLITLSVIGVVAALTIPVIMNSTQQAQYKTTVKKAMSVLNQALTLSIAQNGTDTTSVTNATGLTLLFQSKLNTVNNSTGVSISTSPFTAANTGNFTTSDGIGYYFSYPSSGSCTTPATPQSTVSTSSGCYVMVTVKPASCSGGGSYTPASTQYSSGTSSSSPTLLCSGYYFAITQNQVIPVSNGTYDIVNYALNN